MDQDMVAIILAMAFVLFAAVMVRLEQEL